MNSPVRLPVASPGIFPMDIKGETIPEKIREVSDGPAKPVAPTMTTQQAKAQALRERSRMDNMVEHGIKPSDRQTVSADGLPTTNFHMHFRGGIPATVTAHYTPFSGTFEDTVNRIKEQNYYGGGKDLSCYLRHYTPTSNRIPVDTPSFAEAAARQMAFEYAQQGVVMAEFRLPAFGDIGGFGKFSDKAEGENKLTKLSKFSQEFLQAIGRGLDEGSKRAQEHGYEPTKFGLILDGNRFTPSVMFGEFEGTREERIEKSIAEAVPKVSRTFEEAIRQVKIKGNPAKICGVGIAGLENDHPASAFAESFNLIHVHNAKMAAAGEHDKVIGISIHAGEVGTVEEATQSVIDAITVGWTENTPLRIGHGILANKEKVREAVGEKIYSQIHFELCATSNYQIADQLNEAESHPSRNDGNINWSSDNDAISGAVGHEYIAAGITPLEARNSMLNGMTGSFLYKQFDTEQQNEVMDRSKRRFDAEGITENATELVFDASAAKMLADAHLGHDH